MLTQETKETLIEAISAYSEIHEKLSVVQDELENLKKLNDYYLASLTDLREYEKELINKIREETGNENIDLLSLYHQIKNEYASTTGKNLELHNR